MYPFIQPIRAIYIEEEPTYSDMFRDVLNRSRSINYLGHFPDAENGFSFLRENEVDLVFLNIDLKNDSGKLWDTHNIRDLDLAIVFVTSNSAHAVQSVEEFAVDYLIKPVGSEDITALLNRLIVGRPNPIFQKEQVLVQPTNSLQEKDIPQRFFINFVGETIVVQLRDVLYLTLVDRYTHVVMMDGTRHISSKTMKIYIDSVLANPDFLRIHRSTIVNKSFVKSLLRDGKQSNYKLEMTNGDKLEVSSLKKDDIMDALKR